MAHSGCGAEWWRGGAHYQGRQRQYPAGWRLGHRDQGPEGQRLFTRRQGWHQSEEHTPGGRRPRHRLQDRWHRRDGAQVGVRPQDLS